MDNNQQLPMTRIDEQTGETLILVKDCYIPEWAVKAEEEEAQNPTTMYMRMRSRYLDKRTYAKMMMNKTLEQHLIEIDKQATEMEERLTKQMMQEQGVTEQLKAENQMEWVGKMNNIRACVREIVLNEVIYA